MGQGSTPRNPATTNPYQICGLAAFYLPRIAVAGTQKSVTVHPLQDREREGQGPAPVLPRDRRRRASPDDSGEALDLQPQGLLVGGAVPRGGDPGSAALGLELVDLRLPGREVGRDVG